MARAMKFKSFLANGMKKAQVIGSKGGKFVKDQLRHPAVKHFAMDALKIGAGAALSGSPGMAGPMLAARAAQEGDSILDRTAHHLERNM